MRKFQGFFFVATKTVINIAETNTVNMVSDVKDELERRILETALRCASEAFKVPVKEILSKSRIQKTAYARHAYAALVVWDYNADNTRDLCITLGRIGGFIDKDHSSMIHSSGTAHKSLMDSRDKSYDVFYNQARKAFLSGVSTIGNAEMRIRLSQIKLQTQALAEERERLMSFKRK